MIFSGMTEGDVRLELARHPRWELWELSKLGCDGARYPHADSGADAEKWPDPVSRWMDADWICAPAGWL